MWIVFVSFSWQVSKLAASPIHTDLLRVVWPTFRNFIPGRDVLFFLNLILPVSESTSISKTTNVQKPIFTNFCFYFHFKARFSLWLVCGKLNTDILSYILVEIYLCSFITTLFFVAKIVHEIKAAIRSVRLGKTFLQWECRFGCLKFT